MYAAAVFAIAVSCAGGKASSDAKEAHNPQVGIKLMEPSFTEIKKSKIMYKGNASYAEYFDNSRLGVITNPRIEGMLSDGKEFTVSSDKAYYYDKKQLITLKHNIWAQLNNNYKIRGNELNYFINKKIVITGEPVTVTGSGLQFHADSGSINLKRNKLIMHGNIHAKIYNMSLK